MYKIGDADLVAKKGQGYRHLPAFILLALAQKSMHGGAIYTFLCESLPALHTDSGAVYRCLQEMEKNGAVTSVWDTSGAGPAKKIYEMTPFGWGKLEECKQDIEMRMTNFIYFLQTYEKVRKAKEE